MGVNAHIRGKIAFLLPAVVLASLSYAPLLRLDSVDSVHLVSALLRYAGAEAFRPFFLLVERLFLVHLSEVPALTVHLDIKFI